MKRGCFTHRPSFTLTLSDSSLSLLITKIIIIKNNKKSHNLWAFHVLEKIFSSNFQKDRIQWSIKLCRADGFCSQVNLMPAFVVIDLMCLAVSKTKYVW